MLFASSTQITGCTTKVCSLLDIVHYCYCSSRDHVSWDRARSWKLSSIDLALKTQNLHLTIVLISTGQTTVANKNKNKCFSRQQREVLKPSTTKHKPPRRKKRGNTKTGRGGNSLSKGVLAGGVQETQAMLGRI